MTDKKTSTHLTRRAALAGVIAASGATAMANPSRTKSRVAPHRTSTFKASPGGSHSPYFLALSAALADAGFDHPVLVIDENRLDANIAAVRQALEPRNLPLRVVVKSLPSRSLIERIARSMATDRFMVFNGAMLEAMASRLGSDLLLGKPLPAGQFAELVGKIGLIRASRIQWLIDTPTRLAQYAEISAAQGIKLRVNLEIDVGLHRGGFADGKALADVIGQVRSLPHVSISGLMGYDPQVPHAPDPELAYAQSQALYRTAKTIVQQELKIDPGTLILNGAGSPTYARHAKDTEANEVSIGSAFVKPADFDTPWLTRHVPASFIATPVLKAGPFDPSDPQTAQGFFIYGGHWLASPESPAGLHFSKVYGRSSNQELLTGPPNVSLRPDDYVFFRPSQSEAVFLQFGAIVLFDGKSIVGTWPTFSPSA